MRSLLLPCLLCVCGVLNAQAAAPFDGLDRDGGRVGYCFYAKSQQLQTLARGSDPLKALTEIKVLESWQAIFNQVLPDRDQRNEQLAAVLSVFNQQVSETGVDGDAAKATVIEAAMPACEVLMARTDLMPQSVAAVPDAVVREASTTPAQRPIATLPPFRPRPEGTPFEKDVFAPGWRGDLLWRDQDSTRRTMIASQDAQPEAQQRPQIHLELRAYGAKAEAHCIGTLAESGVSADGLTLLARPAPGNVCGSDRVVRFRALAADRLQVIVEDGGNPVASGEFRPVNADARLPETPALLALFAQPEPKTVEPMVEPASEPTPEVTATAASSETTAAQGRPRPVALSLGNDCATCLPRETAASPGPDLYSGLFDPPLEGRFFWNWHESGLAYVRTQGSLKRLPDAGSRFRFSLTFDSEYTAVCVGTLEEVGRSEGGYIVHLRIADGEGGQCQPRVTHGYLYPDLSGNDPPVASFFALRLYDAKDRMVTNALLRTVALEAKNIDVAQASRAIDAVRAMESRAKEQRKDRRLAALQARADYPFLEPFYNACLGAADGILGVQGSSPYCLCMTYKFGVGGRIPDAEFQSYSRDFSRLVAQFSSAHTEENKLYVRLDKVCKSCSDSRFELGAECAEPDLRLYLASNYEQLIGLLDKEEPFVEASDYYRKVFFRTYLQGYSLFCENQIVDPVRFDYTVTEYDIGDPWADPAGRVTQHDVTYVTRRYAERYERFRKGSGGVTYGQVAGAISSAAVTSEAQLRRQVGDVKRRMEIEYENRRAIRDHLRGQCESPSVRRVYANLDDLIR